MNEQERERAWEAFKATDLYRLLIASDTSDEGCKLVFDAGWNDGLRAALRAFES